MSEQQADRDVPGASAKSRRRLEYVGFVAGGLWVAALLVPLRFGGDLTWSYVMRMTLVTLAVAIPMIYAPNVRLFVIRSRFLDEFGVGAVGLAYLMAALLYLLAIGALFALMEIFW